MSKIGLASVPRLASVICALCIASNAALAGSVQFDASRVQSSATTVPSIAAADAARLPVEALADAQRKLDAAVTIAARFDTVARQQGLDANWRYAMIANLMKADEANFPAVAYAPDLDRARLAAHDIATMPQRAFDVSRAKPGAAPGAAGAKSLGFGNPVQSLVYVPISPCRIVDTRAGAILDGHTAHDYYFDVGNVGSAGCSVSASNSSGAFPSALAINATVVAATFASPSAYLAIYPQGSAKSSSFLNYSSGQTIANAGLIAINQSNGEFTVFNQESTQLIVDVFGFFVAPGGATTASGAYSTALGLGTIASGGNSTALGYFTVAAGSDSTAMGHFSTAADVAPFSTAMGYAAQTGAPAAMSLGNHTHANGDSSVAMGYYTTANFQRATAMGESTLASQEGATAMGSSTQATAGGSTAMGSGSIASGAYSTAMGASTQAQGAASTAMGQQTVASGNYSTAMGYSNNANGYVSTTMGLSNTASGNMSTAIGYNNNASGAESFAGGQGNIASGTGSVALGIRAVAQQDYSFVFNGKTDTTAYAHDGSGSFNVSTPAGGGIDFTHSGQYCYMNDNTSGWNCSSDRNLKTAIMPIDGREVLVQLAELPVSTWEWKKDVRPGHKHLGPMAQDFMAAFHLGEDDKSISSTDAQGVALAAIKGLYSLLQERESRLTAQAGEIADLRARLDAQDRRMATLESMAARIAQQDAAPHAAARPVEVAFAAATR